MESEDVIKIQLEYIGKLSVKLHKLKEEKVNYMSNEREYKTLIEKLNKDVRSLNDELKIYKEANKKLIDENKK